MADLKPHVKIYLVVPDAGGVVVLGTLKSGSLPPGVVVLPGVLESGVVVLPGIGVTLLGTSDPGAVILPGAPESGSFVPGLVLLPGVPESGVVVLPGAGVMLLGVPESGTVVLLGVLESGSFVPGLVVLFGEVESGTVVLPGAGVKLLGVPGLGTVVLLGAVLSGSFVPGLVVLESGVLVVPGKFVLPSELLGVSAVPPGQREFSGKYSHRIFMPSSDILISVGELMDVLLDSAIGDLLDWARATLLVSDKVSAVPIRLRDFPFILKLTSTEHSAH